MKGRNEEAAGPPREPRIAVIGAGPAGLAVAHYLRVRGYTEVVVFEKLARVGGLCKSITDGHRAFDLGGTYLTPAYRETLKIARSVGAQRYRAQKYHPIQVDDDTEGYAETRLDQWARYGLSDALGRIGWWRLVCQLLRFWRERRRVRQIVDSPWYEGVEKDEALCVSFEQWLRDHDLADLARIFDIPVTMMGYGFLHEVAAPYVLKYMAGGTFWAMMLRGIPGLDRLIGWPHRFVDGFQRMWERLAEGLNVRTDVAVERIVRGTSDDLPVRIDFSFMDRLYAHDVSPIRRSLYFDKLILACPFTEEVLGVFFRDDLPPEGEGVPPDAGRRSPAPRERQTLSEEERRLFDQIEVFTYVQTTLHAVEKTKPGEDAVERPFRLPAAVVPVFPFSSATVGKPWVVVQVWGEESRLLQFYSRVDFPEGTEQEGKSAIVARDHVLGYVDRLLHLLGAERAGATDERLARWVTYDRWPYFGHVSPENIRGGFFRDLEKLQGQQDTYYVGGEATFEMVESIVQHAKHIADKLGDDLASQRFCIPRRRRRVTPYPLHPLTSESI